LDVPPEICGDHDPATVRVAIAMQVDAPGGHFCIGHLSRKSALGSGLRDCGVRTAERRNADLSAA
jgi:hypothetical protein